MKMRSIKRKQNQSNKAMVQTTDKEDQIQSSVWYVWYEGKEEEEELEESSETSGYV